jgi:hypothetical protein
MVRHEAQIARSRVCGLEAKVGHGVGEHPDTAAVIAYDKWVSGRPWGGCSQFAAAPDLSRPIEILPIDISDGDLFAASAEGMTSRRKLGPNRSARP